MKSIILLGISSAFGLMLLNGCAYHTKAVPTIDPCAQFANLLCDTSNKLTYEVDIMPIMEDNSCNSCHGSTPPKLDSKASLTSYLKDCNTRLIFENAINHIGGIEAKYMPQGSDKMDSTQIKKFQTWICQGMK